MSHVKALGTARNRSLRRLKIGFAGPCPPTRFDEELAARLIQTTLDQIVKDYPGYTYVLVSGHTNVGALKLAYQDADDRCWWTVGVASQRAKEHPLFEVDEVITSRHWVDWGNESERFVEECDVLFALGDGPQTLREAFACAALGKRVYRVDLPLLRG